MAENTQYDALRELALNLRWSWHHSSDELWGKIDPELWELTQNPWAVLQAASQKRLAEVLRRPCVCAPGQRTFEREARVAQTPDVVSERASFGHGIGALP